MFGVANGVLAAGALGVIHSLPLIPQSGTVEAVGVGLIFWAFFVFLNKEIWISAAFGVMNAGVISAAHVLGLSPAAAIGITNGFAGAALVTSERVRAWHGRRAPKPRSTDSARARAGNVGIG